MPNILVVTGSVRPNSVNEKIVPVVVEEIEKQGSTITIADLKELNLPFFDAPASPMMPEFNPTNEAVKQWTQMVADADKIVLVTPEYNHTLSPVQLNAIDWVGKEWEGKKIALVGYGWGGAGNAHTAAREAFEQVLKADVVSTQAGLVFMKDINPDGTFIDEEASRAAVAQTITELLN